MQHQFRCKYGCFSSNVTRHEHVISFRWPGSNRVAIAWLFWACRLSSSSTACGIITTFRSTLGQFCACISLMISKRSSGHVPVEDGGKIYQNELWGEGVEMTSASFSVASLNEREYCATLSWLANTSSFRCFYLCCVTSGGLTQPTLNQTNSGGLAEAPRCNVCKSGLLSRAAFKGHVFCCCGALELLAERRVHSSQTCNSSVRNLSSHIFHSGLWKCGVASHFGIAASALPGTRKFAGMKYDIQSLPASSRKTNERVGDSRWDPWTGCNR